MLGTVPKEVCHCSPPSIFCLGCKTISHRVARRLIVSRLKQNTPSELKKQKQLVTFCGALKCCSSVKGLKTFQSMSFKICSIVTSFYNWLQLISLNILKKCECNLRMASVPCGFLHTVHDFVAKSFYARSLLALAFSEELYRRLNIMADYFF